jgi:haloalkane dehalogenase
MSQSDSLQTFLDQHPGRDFDRNGLRYHYLDEGDGEPVVMVHGNPSWSFYYRKLVDALKPEYRTIVPDHIGCGRSDKPGDDHYDYALESRVDDLEALLDHLNLTTGLTLVLHDWGGAIGMGFAARHPERVARLVILNTAAFALPKEKAFPWPLWACRDTPLSAWLVRGANAFALGTARIGCKRSPMSREVRDAYVAPYDSWRNRIAVHRFVQDIPLSSTDRSYSLLSFTQSRLSLFAETPMLMGWGMRDFVFDHHFLAEWERRFPGAEVHRFPEAGHYVLEDEADRLVPLVQAFLARHPLMKPVG